MTTGDLIALLEKFPPDTLVEFASHDGPEYGWLDIGTEYLPDNGYLRRTHTISNDGLEAA